MMAHIFVVMLALSPSLVVAMGPQNPEQTYYGQAVALQALIHAQVPHRQPVVVGQVLQHPVYCQPVYYPAHFNYLVPFNPYNPGMYPGVVPYNPAMYSNVPVRSPIVYPGAYPVPTNFQIPMPVAAPVQQLSTAPRAAQEASARAVPAQASEPIEPIVAADLPVQAPSTQAAASLFALSYAESDPERNLGAEQASMRTVGQRKPRGKEKLDRNGYLTSHNCRKCGIGFDTSSALQSHTRSAKHTEKKFFCTYDEKTCEKKYLTKKALDHHIRTKHKGEKPFACRICSKQYAYRSSCDNHERRMHQLD